MKRSHLSHHTVGSPSRWAAALAVLATLGCGSDLFDSVDGRTNSNVGELKYVCVDWGDPLCRPSSVRDGEMSWSPSDLDVPEAIVLGSRFGMSSRGLGAVDGFYSAAPHIIEPVGALEFDGPTSFIAVTEGRVGLYALRADQALVRYVHVDVVPAAAIVFDDLGDAVFATGGTYSLHGELVDEDGRRLGGAVPWYWSIEPAGVLDIRVSDSAIEGAEYDDIARLDAIAPGRATLRVEAAGVVSEFIVTVE